VIVERNYLNNNSLGDHGVYFYQALSLRIRDNRFENANSSALKIWANQINGLPTIRSWVADDNTFDSCNFAAQFVSDSLGSAEVPQISFSGNRITNDGGATDTGSNCSVLISCQANAKIRLAKLYGNSFKDLAKGAIAFTCGTGGRIDRVEIQALSVVNWSTSSTPPSPPNYSGIVDDGSTPGRYGTLSVGGHFDGNPTKLGLAALNVSQFERVQVTDVSQINTSDGVYRLYQQPTGYLNIDVGSITSPYSLTEAQFKCGTIEFTGTLAADIVINFPQGVPYGGPANGSWFLRNSTLGARAVKVGPGPSGIPIAIAATKGAWFFYNGSYLVQSTAFI
jgi:hypothetical protein